MQTNQSSFVENNDDKETYLYTLYPYLHVCIMYVYYRS